MREGWDVSLNSAALSHAAIFEGKRPLIITKRDGAQSGEVYAASNTTPLSARRSIAGACTIGCP